MGGADVIVRDAERGVQVQVVPKQAKAGGLPRRRAVDGANQLDLDGGRPGRLREIAVDLERLRRAGAAVTGWRWSVGHRSSRCSRRNDQNASTGTKSLVFGPD